MGLSLRFFLNGAGEAFASAGFAAAWSDMSNH
jgi:hypothetical protein